MSRPNVAGPDAIVLDESRLLAEFGDDPEILEELRDLFLQHIPPLLEDIKKALQAGEAARVAQAAHSLKGASSTYGAQRLAQVGLAIEKLAREDQLAAAQDVIEILQEELAKVTSEIGSVKVGS